MKKTIYTLSLMCSMRMLRPFYLDRQQELARAWAAFLNQPSIHRLSSGRRFLFLAVSSQLSAIS